MFSYKVYCMRYTGIISIGNVYFETDCTTSPHNIISLRSSFSSYFKSKLCHI